MYSCRPALAFNLILLSSASAVGSLAELILRGRTRRRAPRAEKHGCVHWQPMSYLSFCFASTCLWSACPQEDAPGMRLLTRITRSRAIDSTHEEII